MAGAACLAALFAWPTSTHGPYARHTVPPAPTFTRDIAPIIATRCVACHSGGGAAPFTLTTFHEVSTRADRIARAVEARDMPPWLPSETGETFAGSRALTTTERETILRWVKNGSPRGPAAEASAFAADGAHRAADLVVRAAEPYLLPAGGPDLFRNFVLRVPLDRSRYVRAVTIDPGSPRAVHHASLAIDRTRTARRLDAMDAAPGFDGMLTGAAQSPPGHFIGWAPGKSAQIAAPGLAWRLDAGADIVLQVHMMPGEAPVAVQPGVAFEFTDDPPSRRAVLMRMGSTAIDIPPDERHHLVEDRFDLPADVQVLAISPHAHYRARGITTVATLPDGSSVPLITIEAWDFRWQDDYRYRTALSLPAGTRITTRVTYDRARPHAMHSSPAPGRVVYGPGTADEMGDVWLQVVPATAEGAALLEDVLARRELAAQTAGYERLASARPDDPLPRFTLATLHLQAGRYDDAIAGLERVRSLAPSLVMAIYNRGVALQRAGRLAEAARDLRAALERDSGYAEAEHALGHVRLAERLPREAEQHFSRAVAIWPEYADGWNSLGTLRASRADRDGAIAACRRAVLAAPDHREALNNLGILLARRGELDEAIALLERAVAAHPADAASRQNLAAARALKP